MKNQEINFPISNWKNIDPTENSSLNHLLDRPEGTVKEENYSSISDFLLGDYEYTFFFEKNNDKPIGARIWAYYNTSLYDANKINDYFWEDMTQYITWEYSLNKNLFVTFNITSIEKDEEEIWLFGMLNN